MYCVFLHVREADIGVLNSELDLRGAAIEGNVAAAGLGLANALGMAMARLRLRPIRITSAMRPDCCICPQCAYRI